MSSSPIIQTIKDAVSGVEKLVNVQQNTIDQQAQLIAKLQQDKKKMEDTITMLQKVDSSDSDAKKVLVDVLKENKLIKDCEEASRDQLEGALTTGDEMTNVFVTAYAGFTKIVENNVKGTKNKAKVHDKQLKLVESLCDKVESEHTGYHADTLSTLLTKEKHRIRMNQRKFRKEYLLSLRHYHD